MNLQTNPDNPRTISKDAYEKLKRSIERNPDGLTANKIGYKDGIIISGNQRYRALQELGLELKPEWFKDLSGWTQEQIDEWVIQSNISAGEWDWDILANEWDTDALIDWGIDMPDDWGSTKDLPEDIDEIPEVKTPVSKLGDIWLLGDHRVMCGDATSEADVERLMQGQKADMCFTDPPYNVDYEGKTTDKLKIENDKFKSESAFYNFLLESFKDVYNTLNDGCPIYVTHADSEGINFRTAFVDAGFYLKQCLIWNKNTLVMGRQDYQWKHEPILYGWKPGASHRWYGKRDKTTVLDIDKPSRSTEHPTMKPVELITKLLENSSKPNNIIIDVFLGSGSTIIACEETNRKCYGLELDPHYTDVICKRWQTLTGELPILESSGEAYDFTADV